MFLSYMYIMGVVVALSVSVKYIDPYTGCKYGEPTCRIKEGCYIDKPSVCLIIGLVCAVLEAIAFVIIGWFIKLCCIDSCHSDIEDHL